MDKKKNFIEKIIYVDDGEEENNKKETVQKVERELVKKKVVKKEPKEEVERVNTVVEVNKKEEVKATNKQSQKTEPKEENKSTEINKTVVEEEIPAVKTEEEEKAPIVEESDESYEYVTSTIISPMFGIQGEPGRTIKKKKVEPKKEYTISVNEGQSVLGMVFSPLGDDKGEEKEIPTDEIDPSIANMSISDFIGAEAKPKVEEKLEEQSEKVVEDIVQQVDEKVEETNEEVTEVVSEKVDEESLAETEEVVIAGLEEEFENEVEEEIDFVKTTKKKEEYVFNDVVLTPFGVRKEDVKEIENTTLESYEYGDEKEEPLFEAQLSLFDQED